MFVCKRLSFLLSLCVLLFLESSCVLLIPGSSGSHPSLRVPCGREACVSPPVVGLRPFIDTWQNLHFFQSFDYLIDRPAAVAKHNDFIWGATPSKVAAFRSSHPDALISYYISFHRDPGTFTNHDIGIDNDGTVTSIPLARVHGLAYWQASHPDWVLYQCDRKTPAREYGDPNIPLDFSNPAMIDWQVQTYAKPASEQGYDAIAADNLNMENLYKACGVYRKGRWVQLYSGETDDSAWRRDILFWVTRMQSRLHALSHPLALIPNLGLASGTQANDAWIQQIISHVDGVLDERGFTNYAAGYLTDDDWLQAVLLMKSVQQQGKPYYSENQFPARQLNAAQIQWALASYLMSKEHLASVNITSTMNGVQGYGDDRWRPEYAASIGVPRSEMYRAQQVWWRDYSGGLVVVNPSSTNGYTVTTSAATYKDLYGNPVPKTFTLQPHSGLVLIPG